MTLDLICENRFLVVYFLFAYLVVLYTNNLSSNLSYNTREFTKFFIMVLVFYYIYHEQYTILLPLIVSFILILLYKPSGPNNLEGFSGKGNNKNSDDNNTSDMLEMIKKLADSIDDSGSNDSGSNDSGSNNSGSKNNSSKDNNNNDNDSNDNDSDDSNSDRLKNLKNNLDDDLDDGSGSYYNKDEVIDIKKRGEMSIDKMIPKDIPIGIKVNNKIKPPLDDDSSAESSSSGSGSDDDDDDADLVVQNGNPSDSDSSSVSSDSNSTGSSGSSGSSGSGSLLNKKDSDSIDIKPNLKDEFAKLHSAIHQFDSFINNKK